MRLRALLRIIGVIIGLTSLSKLPSVVVALLLREGTADVYFGSFLMSALIGLLLWLFLMVRVIRPAM